MNEQFDFSKKEEQKQFQELPKKAQEVLIDQAQEEAIELDKQKENDENVAREAYTQFKHIGDAYKALRDQGKISPEVFSDLARQLNNSELGARVKSLHEKLGAERFIKITGIKVKNESENKKAEQKVEHEIILPNNLKLIKQLEAKLNEYGIRSFKEQMRNTIHGGREKADDDTLAKIAVLGALLKNHKVNFEDIIKNNKKIPQNDIANAFGVIKAYIKGEAVRGGTGLKG